jgi:hypothetical protein
MLTASVNSNNKQKEIPMSKLALTLVLLGIAASQVFAGPTQPTPVPEPSTYLAGVGALAMLGTYIFKNRKSK